MKKLFISLAVFAVFSVTAQARAADAPKPGGDRAAMIQLSVIEAQTSMLALCGIEDGEYLERNKALEAKLMAGLSEEGKKSLPDALAKISEGVKTSWETTPEDQRAKSCEALKASMSK